VTRTSSCLDGETLAAWVDGGLSRSDAAMAEAHVSSCPRCQEIAGLIVKTTPAAVVDVPWWRRRAAWLVPAAVGVTAAGLLMIAPADPAPGVAPPTAAVATPAPETKPTAAAPSAPPAALPAEPALAQNKVADEKKERRRDERGNTAAGAFADRVAAPSTPTQSAAAPSAAPAPPAAAAERLANEQSRQKSVAAEPLARQSVLAAGARAAVSPDGTLHWRITDRGALERSTDRGTTWQAVNVDATATFISVQAPDPRTAVVTAADGRVFRSSDGGVTWKMQDL
jgi:hypothetical protein